MHVRSLWRSLFCLGLIGLTGCPNTSNSEPAGGTSGPTQTTATTTPAKLPPKPWLKDWAQPKLALLFTGEQHGYLEPCGCSEMQSGGLSRRFDLRDQLRKKGWSVQPIDLGGTIKRSREQSFLKLETVLKAYQKLGYRGVGLGKEELLLGADTLLRLSGGDYLPFISANTVLFDSPDLGLPIPLQVVEQDGVKIGITAIIGETYRADILPSGGGDQQSIKIQPAAEALPTVIEKLQAEKPDLLVLLSYAKIEESQELARKFPEFQIVVSAGGPEDPRGETEKIGETLFLQVGNKGKHAGVVGYYPDSKEPLKFELVNLDAERFAGTADMKPLMQVYQEQLRDANLVQNEAAFDHPSGATFVGAAVCGKCHTKAYSKWKESKHAHALESLSKGRKGQEADWIDRTFDPECIACHVTGWQSQEITRYTSGYESQQATPHLIGQQCENCHGPGSAHSEQELAWQKKPTTPSAELLEGRKTMSLKNMMQKDRLCYQCHDMDNSPKFDFDKYWKEVAHPWRD